MGVGPDGIETSTHQWSVDPKTGLIREILDKSTGYRFRMGKGGELVLDRDLGNLYEPVPLPATELTPASRTVIGVEAGPLRARLLIKGKIGNSRFTQELTFFRDLARMDVRLVVDFDDPHRRLRVRIPTGLRGETRWVHEVPFGTIERSPEEHGAQNFVDLSDGVYGLALVNNGIPGHERVKDEIRMTLVRSTDLIFALDAGPGALDLGRHDFRYALLPHQGSWEAAGLPARALSTNVRPRVKALTRHTGALPPQGSYLSVEPPGMIVSAVELERPGQVLVRLYESLGRRTRGVVSPGFSVSKVRRTDFLGTGGRTLERGNGGIRFSCGGFRIVTLRLAL